MPTEPETDDLHGVDPSGAFDEPIGSCDNCDGDVYEDEAHEIDGALLCDQCAWYALGGPR